MVIIFGKYIKPLEVVDALLADQRVRTTIN
jgi:hypothetical protein